MKIRFHGRLADAFGRELDLAIEEPCTIQHLRERIAGSSSSAAALIKDRRVRACVCDEMVTDDHPVRPTDAVEFLAPVSGG